MRASTLIFPGATYVINKEDAKSISALEMRARRNNESYTSTTHRINESILKELKIGARLNNRINRHLLKYYKHIARRETNHRNDNNCKRHRH